MTKQEYQAMLADIIEKFPSEETPHPAKVMCEYIASLEVENANLKADNRSLVEQMNQMALKPNQEIIEWHNYPEEKPERPVGTLIPNPVSQLSLLVEYQTIDGGTYVCTDEYYWLNEPGFGLEIDVTVLAWAYMPKGEKHEQEIETQNSKYKSTDNDTCRDSAGNRLCVPD